MLEHFTDWVSPATMEVQERVTTVTNGRPSTTWTTVEGLSAVRCWAYSASTLRQFVDDRLKSATGMYILVKPSDLGGKKLTSKMRGIVDGREWYFNEPDDVLKRGEVLVVLADGADRA